MKNINIVVLILSLVKTVMIKLYIIYNNSSYDDNIVNVGD